jgi:hypothetical protein
MLKNGIYVLKSEATLSNGLIFKQGQEIEVVANVVYMGGFPLPFNLQAKILNWMSDNLSLFKLDNRNF